MKNLEEMKGQLLNCAREEAREMVAQTKKEIEERKKEEEERINCRLSSLRQKEERALRDSYLNYQEQLKKQGELYVLREKQKQIEELITKAYHEILKWKEDNYFSFLESLITARMRAEDGILYFGERDLNRLPKNFEKILNKQAKKMQGSITIAKEPALIEGGFILCYGGIEENASIDALFEALHEQMTDSLNQLLFEAEA
ncbi:MAG: hypothetical protein J6D02_01075 [Lachnospira sp.]|nr:hypothetical protein [Lachnospira sp.]